MERKSDQIISNNRENIINDIFDLVSIKSVNGHKSEVDKALDCILKKADTMGMNTMKSSKGDIGIAEIGSGKEILGILVHVDVVDVGDTDKWTYPPFEGHVSKGYIWGRGVVDDKGPAVMCLYAMKAIKEMKLPIDKRIWLIIGTTEEGQWTDIDTFKEEFEMPTWGFSPDGDFPIYNREMGYCDITMVFHENDIENIEILEAGDSVNTVPSKAVFKIKDQNEKIYQGVSCHSSTPGLGVNSINRLAIGNSNLNYNFIRFLNDFLSKDYNATKMGLDFGQRKDAPASERSIVVPTIIKKVDDTIILNVNLRLWFNVTLDRVREVFNKYAQEYNYEFSTSDYLDSKEEKENQEFIKSMADVYEEYGFKNEFCTAVGTTYSKSMKHFVNWGPVFPLEPSCAHMEDERLSVECMIKASQMYTTYIAQMAGSADVIKEKLQNMTAVRQSITLMEFFAMPPYEYNISQMVEMTGMNRSTLYRDLSALEESGLLERNNKKNYYLGNRVVKYYEAIINRKKDDK